MSKLEALSMSLDDIIKKNRTNVKDGPSKGRGAIGDSDRMRRGAGQQRGPDRQIGRGRVAAGGRPSTNPGLGPSLLAPRGAGVQKRSAVQPLTIRHPAGQQRRAEVVGLSMQQGQGFGGRNQDAPADREALDGGGKWKHDMFDRTDTAPLKRIRSRQQGATLMVSNLDYNVSDDDIKELFSFCGPLEKCGVVYDRSGRSEGCAEIIFRRKEDAQKAYDQYNGVALDGKKMEIFWADTEQKVLKTLRSGISVTKKDAALGKGSGGGLKAGSAGYMRSDFMSHQERSSRQVERAGRGGLRSRMAPSDRRQQKHEEAEDVQYMDQ